MHEHESADNDDRPENVLNDVKCCDRTYHFLLYSESNEETQ